MRWDKHLTHRLKKNFPSLTLHSSFTQTFAGLRLQSRALRRFIVKPVVPFCHKMWSLFPRYLWRSTLDHLQPFARKISSSWYYTAWCGSTTVRGSSSAVLVIARVMVISNLCYLCQIISIVVGETKPSLRSRLFSFLRRTYLRHIEAFYGSLS